ncbi:hypothetical protein HJC23_008067 [Cyclotella cryptica]|uniref:Roadblock/LAMTOR2 domain-containing protein n=1 Tax=Cyclotella cryptica TaxID=29204 RepID=A0ABD3NZ08_9STRA|eukprot:CCRYP_018643-RA/>CCRYP_018643-RA protein AED:0.05 eAED:0.05 QI:100/1/1/1/1/1/2/90/237
MIRSRSIATVLSRATGEGIHAVLLIDADGELLGSYGSPPPPPPQTHEPDNTVAGISTPTSSSRGGTVSTPTIIPSSSNGSTMNNNSTNNDWPLDAASIGALMSEVTGDYRRLGEELVLLDPQNGVRSTNEKAFGGSSEDDAQRENQIMMQGESRSLGDVGGKEVASVVKGNKKGNSDFGGNMKSLVIELEYGVVAVASAGPGYYVIALADLTVQQGALTGRLKSLGSQVREALSQLY